MASSTQFPGVSFLSTECDSVEFIFVVAHVLANAVTRGESTIVTPTIWVRHNWSTPPMEVKGCNCLYVVLWGSGYSKSALGSGMLFPDPIVGNSDPFSRAALLSLAAHIYIQDAEHVPATLPLQGPILPIHSPCSKFPLFGKDFPTCSQRLSLLAGLPGSSGCTARRSLARRASRLWQLDPGNAAAMGRGRTRSPCPR